MKYIYLDFDGVLHPSFARKDQLFQLMPSFISVVEEARVKIVISSSWRFQESFEYLQALFPMNIQHNIYGCTGDAYIGKWARWNEIKRHVRNNRVDEWIALDDAYFEFPPDCGNLILCEGSKGLQIEQIFALKEWLAN
jgi:hypothetical protein